MQNELIERAEGLVVEIKAIYTQLTANVEATMTAKLDRKALENLLDTDIRRQPATYGLEKVTENAIASKIAQHPQMTAAEKKETNLLIHQKQLEYSLNAHQTELEIVKLLMRSEIGQANLANV